MTRRQTNEIAGELYLVPPAGFVAARDELVRQSHAAGHRELAGELRRLRRPTLSAWLVNLLVRHERAPMDRLLAVGRRLRDAQAQLDTEQLRTLAGLRQQLIAELLDRGRRRAAEAGVQPSGAVLAEVEETLKAALVDLAASSTVLSGRLVRPMSHSGFGPMPSTAPPSAAPAASRPASRPASLPTDFRADDELGRRRAAAAAARDGDDEQDVWHALSAPHSWSAQAEDEQDVWQVLSPEPDGLHAVSDEEQDVRRAAAELAAAQSEHWQREFELADAEGAVDAARDRTEWLDNQRIQARRDKVTAERHLAEAQSAQQSAVRAVEDARRALEDAERRLRSGDT